MKVTMEHFKKLASFVGVSEAATVAVVTEFTAQAKEHWSNLRMEPETPAFMREAIDEHLQNLQV